MTMNEVKKCPKCGGEMKDAALFPRSTLGGFWKPRTVLPYVCRVCGYIELYEKANREVKP
jgi:predicted nucleic-acid-binding Zn-ribbon protein